MSEKNVYELIRETDPKIILDCVSICDGWTIFKPEAFTDKGLDPRIVEAITTIHRSDGTWKGSIWGKNGEMIPSLKGVNGLGLLSLITDALKLNPEMKLGRGFQASAYMRVIKEHFKNKTDGYKKTIEWNDVNGSTPEIGETIFDMAHDSFEVIEVKKINDLTLITMAYRGKAE